MPTLTFKCGDTTCFDHSSGERGHFCRFVVTSRFGTKFLCSLFEDEELKDENGVPSGEGRLQRLPECLKLDEQAVSVNPALKITQRIDVVPNT